MSVSSIFEQLTGVSGLDSQQTALAVQALLDSQSLTEAAATPVDDDDIFQCGKCKKQFTNFSSFVTHKQTPCINVTTHSILGLRTANNGLTSHIPNSATSALKQELGSYSTVPSSPLAQALGHNIVLTDDLISFTTPVEQTLPVSTLQVGSNPFLSQVSPSTPKSTSSNTVVLTSTANNSFTTSTSSAFTALHGGQLQLQPLSSMVGPPGAGLLGPAGDQAGTAQVIIQASGAQTLLTQSGTAGGIQGGIQGGMQGQIQAGIQGQMQNKPLQSLLKPLSTNLAASTTAKPEATYKVTTVPQLPVAVLAQNGEMTMTPMTPMSHVPQPAPTPKARRTKPVPEEHDTKKKHKCQYCDKMFGKNFDLQQHVRSHTGEKPFQCIVCGRAFAQKSNVKKHMKTHMVWPQGTGKTLPNQPAPQIIEHHDIPDDNITTLESTNTTVTLPPTTIKMNVTKKQRKDSKEDPITVSVLVDNTYMCQYCSLKFKSYFNLKSHMSIHKDQQVYKCILKVCSQTFKDLDSFLEHTKTHEENMTYRCHMCNKMFPSLYELGVHQYSHSLYPNQGPKPGPRYFRCVKCNSKYSTPEALQHHLDTVSHKHPCPHCPKMFACERYLRRHLPLHGSEGGHSCIHCGKTFKTDNYLKVHLLTHSTDKPFGCDMCSAAFNRKDKLKRHMLIHETTKKFKCPFRHHVGCTREFSRPDKLKAHIICHSGLKPFTCKECNKTFTRRSNLHLHERGHRKDYTHKCAKCGKGFLREKLFQMHKCRLPLVTPLEQPSEGKERKEMEPKAALRRVNPARTTEMSTRRKMITITKNMVQARAPAKRGRPKRSAKAIKHETGENPAQPSEETLQQTTDTVNHQVIGSIVALPPEDPFQDTETQVTEISVVVGDDTTAQYMTQESTLVQDSDGSVVVIQPLANVQSADLQQHNAITLPIEASNGTDHYEIQTDIITDHKDVYPVTQDVTGLVSASGDIVSSYSLEYQPSQPGLYQPSYTNSQAFQSATLIATGPNMATLVVEGPSGEVISQENITTIVTQGPEDYTDDTDGQSYSVLQYPLPGQEEDHVTLETNDITTEVLDDATLKVEHSLSKVDQLVQGGS